MTTLIMFILLLIKGYIRITYNYDIINSIYYDKINV